MTKSRNQEKAIAKRVDGNVCIASGAVPGNKGDVRGEHFLVEAKRTDKSSISIKQAWLDKIEKEARAIGKSPQLHIEIQDKRYVLLWADDFVELLEKTCGV